LARNIDSRSGANAQQRFKKARAPIRSLQISISQSLFGDLCNTNLPATDMPLRGPRQQRAITRLLRCKSGGTSPYVNAGNRCSLISELPAGPAVVTAAFVPSAGEQSEDAN
jgi:hypothetical protein